MKIMQWITQKVTLINELFMQLEHYEETEILHQYRVNLRKLQSFTQIYSKEIEKKNVPKFTKIIKKIIKPTSKLRDLDVFLDDIHLIECSLHAKNALKILLVSQRKVALEEFLYQKETLEYKQNLSQLGALVHDCKLRIDKEESAEIIKKLDKKMRKKFHKINSDSSLRELHRLRIDFKILRYGLALHNECFETEEILSLELYDLKMLQDLFGVIQDNNSRLQFIFDNNDQFSQEEYLELKSYFEEKIDTARRNLLALVAS